MKFFNIEIVIIYVLLASFSCFTVNSHYKNKNSHIYYKNKYYDYGEEPILLERSTVKKGYIKPNIIIPKYKSIAKTVDERIAIPNLNASLSSESIPDNKYLPTSAESNESESETGEHNIAFDSNSKNLAWNNYKSVSIMQNGQIIKPNQKEISNINDYTKHDLSEDDGNNTRKNNKNDILSASEDKLKNNVYFAENDLDFLVNKKLRESESSNPDSFTKISLQERENDKKLKAIKIEKKVENNKWFKKLQAMLKDLEEKILQNPKDYDFYFKDVMFELKQELISEKIIEPSSYHLDDLTVNSDFEKLRKIEKEKRLENLENTFLKEKNNEELKVKSKIDSSDNTKKERKENDTKKMINNNEFESKIKEIKVEKELKNIESKINTKEKKNSNIKIERLNVGLKKDLSIQSTDTENSENESTSKIEKSSFNSKKAMENDKTKLQEKKEQDIPHEFKFKQSVENSSANRRVSSEDVENKSILSDLLKSLK